MSANAAIGPRAFVGAPGFKLRPIIRGCFSYGICWDYSQGELTACLFVPTRISEKGYLDISRDTVANIKQVLDTDPPQYATNHAVYLWGERSIHYLKAQLSHHGLPRSSSEAACKERLRDAIDKDTLKVPKEVLALEVELRNEYKHMKQRQEKFGPAGIGVVSKSLVNRIEGEGFIGLPWETVRTTSWEGIMQLLQDSIERTKAREKKLRAEKLQQGIWMWEEKHLTAYHSSVAGRLDFMNIFMKSFPKPPGWYMEVRKKIQAQEREEYHAWAEASRQAFERANNEELEKERESDLEPYLGIPIIRIPGESPRNTEVTYITISDDDEPKANHVDKTGSRSHDRETDSTKIKGKGKETSNESTVSPLLLASAESLRERARARTKKRGLSSESSEDERPRRRRRER